MGNSIRSTVDGDRCVVAVISNREEVARLTILDRQMRVGEAWVRAGAIAGVKTKPSQRGKGYGRELMEGALAYMRDHGYPVSILFGIPGFYHRFGFANVLPSTSLARIRTAAAETLAATLPVREAAPADADALLAIYNAANSGRTGTLGRKLSAFSQWLADDEDWWQEERRVLVAEENGAPVAYALGDPEWLHEGEWNMRPYEIGALPGYLNAGTASLLRALAGEAVERRAEWLACEMPADSPLLGVLKLIGFTQEIEYAQNQGGMGRIIDLSGLTLALSDAVGERARDLGPDDRVGRVEFACPDERAAIECGAGRKLHISLPQQNLLQLLMGYHSVAELRMEFPGCVAEGDVATADALFPAGYPYMWRLDHF